ncbi:MAG: 50S ribosomal protein L5 [Kiritimatiellae bacterium]|nr:50S ribosomal protein L5 [Kiritimatiellia bacterium]
MTTLRETYKSTIVPKLKNDLGLKNVNQVPKIEKVVINMGFGVMDKNSVATHVTELTTIAGQKPAMMKARKSVSNFKLREGMLIGAKVTLRGPRMYEFLERLINASLPRIRDFRGVSGTSFDAQGNYTIGINDQSIFAELDPDKISQTQGMDITIVTSTHSKKETRQLLLEMGMPFADKDK